MLIFSKGTFLQVVLAGVVCGLASCRASRDTAMATVACMECETSDTTAIHTAVARVEWGRLVAGCDTLRVTFEADSITLSSLGATVHRPKLSAQATAPEIDGERGAATAASESLGRAQRERQREAAAVDKSTATGATAIAEPPGRGWWAAVAAMAAGLAVFAVLLKKSKG